MIINRNYLRKLFYKVIILHFCLTFICPVIILDSFCSDWSMWRYDANRSAASPENLPTELHLQWVNQYTKRTMVWDDPLNNDLMHYDRVFEPVVMNKTLFIGFNDCDKVTAIDTETGKEKWSFYTDGPVRFPPVASKGKVFFTSDDGYLYCVNASSGKLVWKFRGGPSARKILGNKRLISIWPARGGPVLKDDTIYFAASIWPFMGTFIYALKAETGEIVWVNDGTGAQFILQPHNSPAFAGVAPQGALVATDDKLLVPGGRSVPACFDRHSGKFLYYQLASNNQTGGSFVCAGKEVFFNHHREKITSVYNLEDGKTLIKTIGKYPVLNQNTFYFSGDSITAVDASGLLKNPKEWGKSIIWNITADASNDLIKAGNCLYSAGKQGITAINLYGKSGLPEILWKKEIDGQVERLIAADDKLFAVTLDGRIMAFGANKTSPVIINHKPVLEEIPSHINKKALSIIEKTGVKEGYALLYGIDGGDFIEALLRNSNLHVIAVDPDGAKITKLRQRLDNSGLYGERVAVYTGDPFTFQSPPYMASLTIVDNLDTTVYKYNENFLKIIFQSIRPYGGKLWLNITGEEKISFLKTAENVDLYGLKIFSDSEFPVLSREGALNGSSDWTHQYGDISNTTKSNDSLVKLPLGILWFGGNSNLDVLPRHAHGPPEQVIGGRLFIEGMDCISARDVYTGRVLWKVKLEGLKNYGIYYDKTYADTPLKVTYNQRHIPGANSRGTNFVATIDYVYVIENGNCLVLDSATGKTVKVISLQSKNSSKSSQWGYIGIYKDYLIAGSDFMPYSGLVSNDTIWNTFLSTYKGDIAFTNFDQTASKRMVIMNCSTGDILWEFNANHGFIHNAITVGNDKIFCLDKIPPVIEEKSKRRGISPSETYFLRAFDIKTGKILWEKKDNIFGTWLSYSKEYDILLQSKRPSTDMVIGEEGKRMIAYRGKDGSVLWDVSDEYATFPIIHGNKIVTEGKIFNLSTGEILYRESPLTGSKIPWVWNRQYGCNYPIASEYLITFRSAAAGFYDFANNSGTGNFGGFKSGCTSNLIAANGVLNAPDYTRTCQCSYQNQTSLALVYMPEVEVWTYNLIQLDEAPIKRVGINLGAPGDRLSDDGTLWLEYPNVGGPAPDIPVSITPENPEWFRHHSSRINGDGLKWVAASGCKGLESITITLLKKSEKSFPYTVRLYFAEPELASPDNRVFNVSIQGEVMLKNFDIIREAGTKYRAITKEFKKIMIKDDLNIKFSPGNNLNNNAPIICGIEIIAER
jgi:outer membrane protein assembly factor BamB